MDENGEIRVDQIMEQIRERARSRRPPEQRPSPAQPASPGIQSDEPLSLLLYDLEELRDAVAAVDAVWHQIGAVNPRQPGLGNSFIQFAKKLIQRGMTWYTRPLGEFGESVARSLNETERACEDAQMNLSNLAASADRWRQATIARIDSLGTRLSDLEKAQKSSSTTTGDGLARLDHDVKPDRKELAVEVSLLKNRLREIELVLRKHETHFGNTQSRIGEPRV